MVPNGIKLAQSLLHCGVPRPVVSRRVLTSQIKGPAETALGECACEVGAENVVSDVILASEPIANPTKRY